MLLTYALLTKGLRSAETDNDPKDGHIDVREWFEAAVSMVPVLRSEIEPGYHQQPLPFYPYQSVYRPLTLALVSH